MRKALTVLVCLMLVLTSGAAAFSGSSSVDTVSEQNISSVSEKVENSQSFVDNIVNTVTAAIDGLLG